MLWVTTKELETALAEAGFLEPQVGGSFIWIWRRSRDVRAWGYTARFSSRLRSRKAIRARLLRTLGRLGKVEVTWVHNDEADFYFLSDIIDPEMQRDDEESG